MPSITFRASNKERAGRRRQSRATGLHFRNPRTQVAHDLFTAAYAHVCRLCNAVHKTVRWKRLLWTYLIPLVLFMCCWDGVVSQLRAYTIGVLSDRTQGFEDHEWSAGSTPIHGQPRHLTFLLGASRSDNVSHTTLHCRYTYEPDSSLSVVRRQLPRISGRTAAPCTEPGGAVHGMDVLEPPRDNRASQSMITMPRSIAVVVGLFIWLIVIPLAHGVVPWAISTRLRRYGWAGGAPGF